MMTVTMSRNAMQLYLHVDGHAGYAEHGKDIVCAAASMLVQALHAAVEGVEKICITYREEPGMAELMMTETPETLPMWRVALEGFRLLGAKYPQNVALRGEFRQPYLVN